MNIIDIGNEILNWVQDKGNWLVSNFLPRSPFRAIIDRLGNVPYMNEIAWFVPIEEIVLLLMYWTSAIALYYGYQLILRWVKAID